MSTFELKKTLQILFFAAFASLFSPHSYAGGGGAMTGGATEWTQVANNAELVKVSLDSAQTAATTVQKYMLQLQQYKTQLINTVGVDPGVLAANIRDVQNSYNNLTRYNTALSQLNGSLTTQSNMYDQRFTEAKLLNLSWKDYVQRVGADAQNGNERAKQRLLNEQAAMEQVNRDYEFVREQQSQIAGAEGQHQSIKILNNQMNRLVEQNARIISLLAQSQGSDKARAEAEEVNRRQLSANEMEQYRKRMDAIRERQRGMVGGQQ